MRVQRILIFICLWCFTCFAGLSKNKSAAKKIFLNGKSLEQAYLRRIDFVQHGSDLIIKNLFNLAGAAYYKMPQEKNSKEICALNIVETAVSHFVRRVKIKSKNFETKEIPVLIFGGILQGGGDFLKELIYQKLSNLNKKKILRVIFSEMGDERAILGAIANAINKLKLGNINGYAVGIDIGGTSIRIGVVNLGDFSLAKKLIKKSVFENQENRIEMQQLGLKIKINSKHLKDNVDLIYFLKDRNSCEEHNLLSKMLIERLALLIEEIKSDLNVKFVAVSTAGTLGRDGFIRYAYNLPFTCVDLRAELEERFEIPVVVENDMYCAALGEYLFGGLRNFNEFMIAGIGTGMSIKHYKFNYQMLA